MNFTQKVLAKAAFPLSYLSQPDTPLEEHARIMALLKPCLEIIRVQGEALERYSGKSLSVLGGRARLNYDGDPDPAGPKMYFEDGEHWEYGSHAEEAQAEVARLEKELVGE